MRLRGISLLPVLFLALHGFARAGDLRLSSPDFAEGGAIPSRFTCEGENIPPALEISGVPAGAKALVLIVDDPDAPAGTFTHWLIWNIPPITRKMGGGTIPGNALQGTNDFGNAGYSGPCPPSGTHRYFFRLSALDTTLRLAAGAGRKEVDDAILGHVIAHAALMGRYAKGQ